MSVPVVFSPGSYEIVAGNKTMRFDFIDKQVKIGFEKGFLFILVIQDNFDNGAFPDIFPGELEKSLRSVKKEGFLEFSYYCYNDPEKTDFFELVHLSVLFEALEAGSANAAKGGGLYNLGPPAPAQRPADF